MAPALAEGRPAILASDPDDPTGAARWVILPDSKDAKLAAIRDFHYADYVVDGLALTRL